MGINSPAEIAANYLKIGEGKLNAKPVKTFLLAIMAGMFIAFAGAGATTASVSVQAASLSRFVQSVIFPAGLAMVLLAGSELFTGNCLLIIPLLEKKTTALAVAKNLLIVYAGNLVGGLLVAAIVVFGKEFSLFGCGMAAASMAAANAKCSLGFAEAVIKGFACNVLVCLGVWMSFSAKDTAGKVLGLFFPVMLFVICGFEHSVANMYYIGAGLFAKLVPEYLAAAGDISSLTWGNFFVVNLLPVTIGNILGGFFTGAMYRFVYLKK